MRAAEVRRSPTIRSCARSMPPTRNGSSSPIRRRAGVRARFPPLPARRAVRRARHRPATYWHRPIIVRDMNTRLGEVIGMMRVVPERPGDDVIDNDLILVGARRSASSPAPTCSAACCATSRRWRGRPRRERGRTADAPPVQPSRHLRASPATPIMWHRHAQFIGVAGTSPAGHGIEIYSLFASCHTLVATRLRLKFNMDGVRLFWT